MRLCFMGLLTGALLQAQSAFDLARPALRVWGMEHGLPSGTVYGFATDTKGRLWAGTVDGAAFYTGQGWVPVRMPKESSSQYIRAILAARDGSVWFGTQDGGLWRLQEGTWSHFQGGRELPSDHVFALAETRDAQDRQVLWVGTGDHGIASLEDGRWRTWGPEQGLPEGTVWRIRQLRGPDGKLGLWAATEKGLCRLEGQRWRVLGPADGFPGGAANDVLGVEEGDGRISVWACLWTGGLARWDGRTWQVFEAGAAFPARSPTSSLGATRDAQGRPILWVGTLNQGLWWFRDGRWHSLGQGQGLATPGILATLPMPGGKPTLWFGIRGGGVASLDLGGWRTLNEALGLPGQEVTCFAETPGAQGAFWVGTASGLVSYSPGRPVTRIRGADLPSDYIIALLASGEDLWVATLKGLARKDRAGWHREHADGLLPPGLVISLLETQNRAGERTLWVGTPGGLVFRTRGRWRLLTRKDGLPHDYVASLCAVPGADGEPVLWVGTRGGGVARYEQGRWTSFGAAAGLPNQTVYALHASAGPDGHPWLWAGTLGGGLALLDLRNPIRWETFTADSLPGLASSYVQRIEADGQGRLYLSTAGGVNRLRLTWTGGAPRPEVVDTFTLGDGLPSQNGSLGASIVDRQGRIWIGTSRGAAALDPAQETPPQPLPRLILERALVADPERPVVPRQVLDHGDQHLRFEFSLPVYHRKEDTRYQTQLLGLEAQPRPWQVEGWRDFTTLPQGSYTMRVRARTYNGSLSEPLDFPFQIAPSPWLHPVAILGYLAAAGAAVYALLRLRTRSLARAVRRRTRIIEAQSAALAESNLKLEALSATDGLTGIANRRHFDTVLARELARHARLGTHLSLLLLDVDHFKAFNDTYGHVAGDACLRQIARIMAQCASRTSDLPARYGGEEFACVLPETDAQGAALLAERIRAAVQASAIPHQASPTAEVITVSLGALTLRPQLETSFTDLLVQVDALLYRAKALGRNRIETAGPEGTGKEAVHP